MGRVDAGFASTTGGSGGGVGNASKAASSGPREFLSAFVTAAGFLSHAVIDDCSIADADTRRAPDSIVSRNEGSGQRRVRFTPSACQKLDAVTLGYMLLPCVWEGWFEEQSTRAIPDWASTNQPAKLKDRHHVSELRATPEREHVQISKHGCRQLESLQWRLRACLLLVGFPPRSR